jgi:hypothetical protein
MSAVPYVAFFVTIAAVAVFDLGRRYGQVQQLRRDLRIARSTLERADRYERLEKAARGMLDVLTEFPDYPASWADGAAELEIAIDKLQAAQREVEKAREVA